MNIVLGQPDSTEARQGISAVDLDQARRGGQRVPLAGQEQTHTGRRGDPPETVWELNLFFTDVRSRQKRLQHTSSQGGTGTTNEQFTSCTPIKI